MGKGGKLTQLERGKFFLDQQRPASGTNGTFFFIFGSASPFPFHLHTFFDGQWVFQPRACFYARERLVLGLTNGNCHPVTRWRKEERKNRRWPASPVPTVVHGGKRQMGIFSIREGKRLSRGRWDGWSALWSFTISSLVFEISVHGFYLHFFSSSLFYFVS